MLELAVLLAMTAVVGWVRPRWSSLWLALAPAALAFAWLLMNEDVPGDRTTFADVGWFVGMSWSVGVVFAIACLLGVVARRATRRRRAAPLRGRRRARTPRPVR